MTRERFSTEWVTFCCDDQRNILFLFLLKQFSLTNLSPKWSKTSHLIFWRWYTSSQCVNTMCDLHSAQDPLGKALTCFAPAFEQMDFTYEQHSRSSGRRHEYKWNAWLRVSPAAVPFCFWNMRARRLPLNEVVLISQTQSGTPWADHQTTSLVRELSSCFPLFCWRKMRVLYHRSGWVLVWTFLFN